VIGEHDRLDQHPDNHFKVATNHQMSRNFNPRPIARIDVACIPY